MAATWGLFVVLVFFTPAVHSSGGDTVLYNSVKGCSSQVRLNPGNIIDIRASVSRGAELLLGGWESSLSNCVASCCHMARCDLVLFKNVGLSQSGRNCYFIHCGSPENCVTVSHEGFTSASITPSEGTKAPTTDSMITSSPSPSVSTTSEPPHTTSPTTHMISQTASVTTMSTTTPTTMSTTTTSPPSTTVLAVSDTTGSPVTHTTPPTTNSSGDGATQPVNTTTESENVNSNQANQQSPPGEADIIVVVPEDECSLDGCDGSGVIVVAVVGSLCVMIIMVVIIVILKRLLNDKKKKRFRNVDYLINGMYT